jgi:hypothetical protein
MMIGPYHSPRQSRSTIAVDRSALPTSIQYRLSEFHHHPSAQGILDQPAEPGAGANDCPGWPLGESVIFLVGAVMAQLDRWADRSDL